jgi:hypothetical protein
MLHTGTANSMVTAQHRPSKRNDTAISNSAEKENERRLHALRGPSGLSPTIIRRFLDFTPHAAVNGESAIGEKSAHSPVQRLDYDKLTPLHFNVNGAAPLPYGHILIENAVVQSAIDPSTTVNIGTAAAIPLEWPLRIASYQFELSDAAGKPIDVTRTYEVNDVTRKTAIAELLADVRCFLKRALRHQLDSRAVDALQLHVARREAARFVPLPATARAKDDGVDLFNLGAADFERSGFELAIVTPDRLSPAPDVLPPHGLPPHVLPPHVPPPHVPVGPQVPNAPLDALRTAVRP